MIIIITLIPIMNINVLADIHMGVPKSCSNEEGNWDFISIF